MLDLAGALSVGATAILLQELYLLGQRFSFRLSTRLSSILGISGLWFAKNNLFLVSTLDDASYELLFGSWRVSQGVQLVVLRVSLKVWISLLRGGLRLVLSSL